MDLYQAILQRHSVRSFSDKPVEKEKLDRVLDVVAQAPTAVNFQAFKVFVIPTKGKKDMLQRIYRKDWFSDAPYVLLVCMQIDKCWVRRDGKSYSDVDGAIIMDHIILAATAEGLGTCWVGAFDEAAAIKLLGLPEGLEPLVFTPLGYEQDTAPKRSRKKTEELVVYL